jgi:hypothetical protein
MRWEDCMRRTSNPVPRLGCGLAVGAIALLAVQASQAQTPPEPVPSMPRNLISPLIPYEQGIANIQAQDAARPKAVQPKLKSDTASPDPSVSPPLTGQPAPGGSNLQPRPQ